MNIPKKIHYVWYGNAPIPKRLRVFMKSWAKMLPDWQIVRWDETNAMFEQSPFFMQAYQAKKWAFASDYARTKIMCEQGGLYLDTDMEILRPIDDLIRDARFFTGMDFGCCDPTFVQQNEATFAPGFNTLAAIFGAEPNHPVLQEMLAEYDKRSFVRSDGSHDYYQINHLMLEKLANRDLCCVDRKQYLSDGVVIYPNAVFRPYGGETHSYTGGVFAIHHYDNSWVDMSLKQRLKKTIMRSAAIKAAKRTIRKIFP